jgi:dihydrofolate reductase
MALTYSMITSLDGYVADENGKFDWAEPDEEVHSFINDRARPVGTYLLGRRMYEVLAYWDDPPAIDEQPSAMREFAELWQAADKVVYSRTLEAARTARTRIERTFDPEAIRQLKAQSDRDVAVGGPELAAQAIGAGLVDDFQLFVVPVVVGGGTHALPRDGRIELELLDELRFGNGTVFLHYRIDVTPRPRGGGSVGGPSGSEAPRTPRPPSTQR